MFVLIAVLAPTFGLALCANVHGVWWSWIILTITLIPLGLVCYAIGKEPDNSHF